MTERPPIVPPALKPAEIAAAAELTVPELGVKIPEATVDPG